MRADPIGRDSRDVLDPAIHRLHWEAGHGEAARTRGRRTRAVVMKTSEAAGITHCAEADPVKIHLMGSPEARKWAAPGSIRRGNGQNDPISPVSS